MIFFPFAIGLRAYEYDLLIWLSEHRVLLLDYFFLIGTMLGTSYAYMVMTPIFFGMFERRKACVYSSVILISILITCILKEIFQVQRPDPSLVFPLYTQFAKGFSFPSGHAQGSLTVWGLLAIIYHKKPCIVVSCVCMILWISFSRLYFGVHFPIDILSGWLFGAVVLAVYIILRHNHLNIPYSAACILMLILVFFAESHRIQVLAATLAGIYAGMFICALRKCPDRSEHPEVRTIGMFLGSAVLLAIGKFFCVSSVISYSLIGLWLSCGSVYLERFVYKGA